MAGSDRHDSAEDHARAEKFAFYGSGQWTIPEGYAAQKFMKGGLRNNQIESNARLCMASAVTGFIATYGVDEPAGCYEDLDACDVLITWGNNPAENHPVLFSRVIDRPAHGVGGRGKAVRVIDIGTRRTQTSELATEFVLMKPQGDVALALGIMHLLIAEDGYDAEFVDKYCNFRAPKTRIRHCWAKRFHSTNSSSESLGTRPNMRPSFREFRRRRFGS